MSKCPFAKLSTLGGLPREGIHSYRVFNYPIVDVAATAAGAYGVSKLTGWSFLASFAGLFLVGESIHHALGIDTKFMTDVLGMNHSQYFSQIETG